MVTTPFTLDYLGNIFETDGFTEDQISQLQGIVQAWLDQGKSVEDIRNALSQIQSTSQTMSNNQQNQITSDFLQSQGGADFQGNPITSSLFWEPQDEPATPAQVEVSETTPELPDPSDLFREGRREFETDIRSIEVDRQNALRRNEQLRQQITWQLGLQQEAQRRDFTNASLIESRLQTIDEMLAEGRSLGDIASNLWFTEDQVLQYVQWDFFDAELSEEARADITKQYDQAISDLEQDIDVRTQARQTQLDRLKQDYQTNVDRTQREIQIQQENLSKMLGLTGAWFWSAGLEGIKLINQQNVELLDDMRVNMERGRDDLNQQIELLGQSLIEGTQRINEQANDAIRAAATSGINEIQRLKGLVDRGNVAAAQQVEDITRQFNQMVEQRRGTQLAEEQQLYNQIVQQYERVQQNREILRQQGEQLVTFYTDNGFQSTIFDVVRDTKTGRMSSDQARRALSQMIQSTVNTLDSLAEWQLFGSKNADFINKQIGAGKSPSEIISEIVQRPEFQQATGITELEFIKGSKYQPSGIFDPNTWIFTPTGWRGFGWGGWVGGGWFGWGISGVEGIQYNPNFATDYSDFIFSGKSPTQKEQQAAGWFEAFRQQAAAWFSDNINQIAARGSFTVSPTITSDIALVPTSTREDIMPVMQEFTRAVWKVDNILSLLNEIWWRPWALDFRNRERLKSAIRDLQLTVKEKDFYNLWVLTWPDMDILNDIVPTPGVAQSIKEIGLSWLSQQKIQDMRTRLISDLNNKMALVGIQYNPSWIWWATSSQTGGVDQTTQTWWTTLWSLFQ